jgi:hypothetical protein
MKNGTIITLLQYFSSASTTPVEDSICLLLWYLDIIYILHLCRLHFGLLLWYLQKYSYPTYGHGKITTMGYSNTSTLF